MKVIFTYWSQAKSESNQFLKEFAAVSNFFAQKHGYETILYTDDLGENYFYKIAYNNILRLPDNILNQFPKRIWNMGKVLTTSLMHEPFIHLDLDLFLYKPIQEEFFNKEAIFFHEEPWMDKVLLDTSFIIKKRPQNLINNNSYRSYNCAMFGGTNYQAFRESAQDVCNFVIENADFLDKMAEQQIKLYKKRLVKNVLYLTNLIEQLWIPNLLKNKGVNIETILYDKNFDEYQLKNYIENYNPANFLNEKNNKEFVKEYYKYFSLVSAKSKDLGYNHCYSENTELFKNKIISFAKSKDLKY